MPDGYDITDPADLIRLGDDMNAFTEQHLMTEYADAQVAHRLNPSTETAMELLRTESAQDRFWEARTREQELAEAATAAQVVSGNLPGLPDDTEAWFQKVEAADERRRVADLYEDDPEAIARAAGVMGDRPTQDEAHAALSDAQFDLDTAGPEQTTAFTTLSDAFHAQDVQRTADAKALLAETAGPPIPAHLRDNPGEQQVVSFADEVDAWYQAVQPTGEIRRVQDAERFDPNGYSESPDAVAVQAPPVSAGFAAAFQPTAAKRWQGRMDQGPLTPPPVVPPTPGPHL